MPAPITVFSGKVVWDNKALADLLRGPTGPVARMQIRNGQTVRKGAQRRVGVSKPPPLALGRQFHRRRPGTLRDSIIARLIQEDGELVVYVGSFDQIAYLHHEGTPPHLIQPKATRRGRRARRVLVFYWPKVGGIVAFPKVNHPGTKPNHYLTSALNDLRI